MSKLHDHTLGICTFCSFPDVARWVLNEQIVRDPTTGVIQYKYELIDDFDPENCEFSGPLVYLHHVIKTRQGQDQTDTTIQVTAGNTSYNNLPDSDSNRSSLDDYKPTEYEPYNHMLHLMVSSDHIPSQGVYKVIELLPINSSKF